MGVAAPLSTSDFPSLGGGASSNTKKPSGQKASQPPPPAPGATEVPAPASSSAFGGPPISASFEKWCKAQLHSLCGNDDITLVYFLCSLTNAAEVRQYIGSYLGETTAARDFA